jgi:hypothetical protein
MLLANGVEQRAGLLGLLGGGWERFDIQALPFDAVWPTVVIADLSCLAYGEARRVEIDVRDPADNLVLTQEATFMRVGDGAVSRPVAVLPLGFRIASAGAWKLAARGSDLELMRLSVEVRLVGR